LTCCCTTMSFSMVGKKEGFLVASGKGRKKEKTVAQKGALSFRVNSGKNLESERKKGKKGEPPSILYQGGVGILSSPGGGGSRILFVDRPLSEINRSPSSLREREEYPILRSPFFLSVKKKKGRGVSGEKIPEQKRRGER